MTLDATNRPAAAALDAARSPRELGAVLRELAAPAAVGGLLRALLDERSDVAPLAAASYAHPNGFDKLVLRTAPTGHKLVLHAWWPRPTPADADAGHIHDHRWSFATAVLAGGYRYVEFEEAPPDADASDLQVFKHVYASPGGARGYEIWPEGRRGLRRLRSGALRRGDVYPLDASVLHLVEIDDGEPTVTLFLQGAPVRRSTRVFAVGLLREVGEVDLPRLSAGAYRAGLRRVLGVVDAASEAASSAG
jgi:hypothetical protein